MIAAHSQGALDARFALAALGLEGGPGGVRAVLSVGAPHHGTPVADWVVGHAERRSLLYWFLKLGNYDLQALSFVPQLRESYLSQHADQFAPVPGVRYASARADCRSHFHASLRMLSWWVGLGDGDGMVTSASQRFGEDLGEFDLDHLSEVDVDEAKRPEREKLFTAFDGVIRGVTF